MNDVIVGDCFKVLPEMPPDSVDLCVTSPPFWGLRDYGEALMVFRGDSNCVHEWGEQIIQHQRGAINGKTAQVGNQITGVQGTSINQGNLCSKCGAWKGQLGLEPHPQMFIDHLVEFGRLVRRVLKPSGLFWLNLGDTYYGGAAHDAHGKQGYLGSVLSTEDNNSPNRKAIRKSNWLQPKQLLMIPSRVACALQDDGWILRSDVIWSKPNHMPESVTDRFTKGYEHFFMFSKQQRYHFDLDSIRTPIISTHPSGNKERKTNHQPRDNHNGRSVPWAPPSWKYSLDDNTINKKGHSGYFDKDGNPNFNVNGKNPGDVWEIPTAPFPGSHFAVFPEALVKRIIKCSSPPKGVVLDPFAGSGTTLRVARRLGRRFIGIEINPEYAQMAEERIRGRDFRLDLTGVDQSALASEKEKEAQP